MDTSTRTPAHVKAHATGRWAETICRVLGTRAGKRWRFVSFRGKNKAEWRGAVDVIAISPLLTPYSSFSNQILRRLGRKALSRRIRFLKRGDLFDIILIQVKGGSARGPTADDCSRLRRIARYYHARDVVRFQWKRSKSSQFSRLGRDLKWHEVDTADLFK